MRPGMDHASPERGDLLERGLHIGNREIRQRCRVARAGTALVDSDHGSPALSLPAATFGLAALGQLDAEQPGPEPAGSVRIISRKLN